MQYSIESKNLIDFPYDPEQPEYHQLFSFDNEKVEGLVSEILYASPTCYLISGYRGSGKTSFIRKVQQDCLQKTLERKSALEKLANNKWTTPELKIAADSLLKKIGELSNRKPQKSWFIRFVQIFPGLIRDRIDVARHLATLSQELQTLEQINKQNNPVKWAETEKEKHRAAYSDILFVYSSFSRNESHTFFLRKIIRDLHESVLQHDIRTASIATENIARLNEQTFWEVKRERSKSIDKESSTEFSLEQGKFITALLTKFGPFVLPFLAEFIAYAANKQYLWPDIPWIKPSIYACSFVLGILNVVKFSQKYSISHKDTDKNSLTSLIDDNITEYQLENVIDKFIQLKYKLVFVLDELDKVDEDVQANLLNEMKPWLVRGKADFIIVAGQKLTMRYYQVKEKEDEVMASLFSKIIHVGLLPEDKFVRIFNDFLLTGRQDANQYKSKSDFTTEENSHAFRVCSSYIYRSKRLPRTFMNLIRQDMIWNAAIGWLPAGNPNITFEDQKMRVLKKMSDQLNFTGDISETIKGHLLMQLFRIANLITNSNRHTIQVDEMINFILHPTGTDKPEKYAYTELELVLNNTIRTFYAEAIAEGVIILQQTEQKPPDDTNIKNKGTDSSENKEENTTSVELLHPKQLQDFKDNFISLIRLLQGSSKELIGPTPDLSNNDTKLKALFQSFSRAGIISFDYDSRFLDEEIQYYPNNASNDSAFKVVYDFFLSKNIEFYTLFESFSHYVFGKFISNIFDVQLSDFKQDNKWWDQLKLPGKRENYFILEKGTIASKKLLVVFEFIYVNGPVQVSGEQINQSIELLDEINTITGFGNYYIPVLFYRSMENTSDSNQSITIDYEIEKLRTDLMRKINYVLCYVLNYRQFLDRLKTLRESIQPYSIVPYTKKTVLKHLKTKKTHAAKQYNMSNLKTLTVYDPDDPQKGKWGGSSEANGRRIIAKVNYYKESKDWFTIQLKVESILADLPLTGKVTFYLHDSFSPDKYTVIAKNNTAEITDLEAYEAFTVGVSCDNNTTKLELDLNDIDDAPPEFRY